jgi:hypothetical protein
MAATGVSRLSYLIGNNVRISFASAELLWKTLSRAKPGSLMYDSQTPVTRVRDPTDGTVTLEPLHRAATIAGRCVELILV